jgi:hypothetical protein
MSDLPVTPEDEAPLAPDGRQPQERSGGCPLTTAEVKAWKGHYDALGRVIGIFIIFLIMLVMMVLLMMVSGGGVGNWPVLVADIVSGAIGAVSAWRRIKHGRIAAIIFSVLLIIQPGPLFVFLVLGLWNLTSIVRAWPVFGDALYSREDIAQWCRQLTLPTVTREG